MHYLFYFIINRVSITQQIKSLGIQSRDIPFILAEISLQDSYRVDLGDSVPISTLRRKAFFDGLTDHGD